MESFYKKRCRLDSAQGFTLIELLATTAVIILLTGIGLPSLSRWIEKSAYSTTMVNLYHLTYYARSEAIRRRLFVTLCPTDDRVHCGKDWSNSTIMIFTDINTNETIDPDTDILLRVAEVPEHISCLQLNASARKKYLQYRPSGTSNGIAGHIRFCGENTQHYNSKLVISLTGRSSIQET